MKDGRANHYETAFKKWLIDNRWKFIEIEQARRRVFNHNKIKSFDFLLYPPNGQAIIAEVKGRKFNGTTFTKLSGFQCWVGVEDVDGLSDWQRIFGEGHTAAFIFAYKIENIDVDFDGRAVYNFGGDNYIFFVVRLDDYFKYMKRRSPKWKTVTLPADDFRRCAAQIEDY